VLEASTRYFQLTLLSVKADKADKPKREPSAYNLFIKAHLKPWLEANPEKKSKEGMVYVRRIFSPRPSPACHSFLIPRSQTTLLASHALTPNPSPQMGTLWKDAEENPNRGNGPKVRKPKEPKAAKEPKPKAAPAAKSKPKSKPKAKKAEEEEEEDDEEKENEPEESDAPDGSDEILASDD